MKDDDNDDNKPNELDRLAAAIRGNFLATHYPKLWYIQQEPKSDLEPSLKKAIQDNIRRNETRRAQRGKKK